MNVRWPVFLEGRNLLLGVVSTDNKGGPECAAIILLCVIKSADCAVDTAQLHAPLTSL